MSTVTISKDRNNVVTIAQNPNPIELTYGTKISMNVGSGFPSGSNIASISFYNNKAGAGGADAKGTIIGTWQRNAPTRYCWVP